MFSPFARAINEKSNVKAGRRASFGVRGPRRVEDDLKRLIATVGERDNLEKLCELAEEGRLRKSSVRTIAWKLLLGVLPSDASPEKWRSVLESKRIEYVSLVEKHVVDPTKGEEENLLECNPLASFDDKETSSESNVWAKFYEKIAFPAVSLHSGRISELGASKLVERN